MANPNSLLNGQALEIDPIVRADGTVKLKLALGSKTVSGADAPAGWEGTATHEAAATVAASDGVVLVATGAVGAAANPVSVTNRMPVAGSLNGPPLTTWQAVTATATLLPASPLSGRGLLDIQAWENNALPVFIGGSGVTARTFGATPGAADGIMLMAGETYRMPLRQAGAIYARATSTGCYVGLCEVPE